MLLRSTCILLAFALVSPQLAAAAGTDYSVKLFASGTSQYFKPDPIVVTPTAIYVAFQNNTTTVGGGGDSTIVEFDRSGTVVGKVNIKGHCDGMRLNPYSGLIWATVNNDLNPALYTFTTQLGQVKKYSFKLPTMHGGGYDDIAFVSGQAFLAGSNPTLNHRGENTHPAIYSVMLSGSQANVTPVLYGNAMATDVVTGKPFQLNEIDPDSLALDPYGDLVLVNQAGSELVTLLNPGSSSQLAYRLAVGTQLEDPAFATSPHGRLWIVDIAQNAIYVASASQVPVGTVFTEAPNDSGVASFVGVVDVHTGIVTPTIVGFSSPTGLVFEAQ